MKETDFSHISLTEIVEPIKMPYSYELSQI
jgi:hypothetical protein